jgi:hypothetical protein
VQSANDDILNISVINNSGVKFYEMEKSITSGKNTIEISDLLLPPAIYYLKIKGTTIDKIITLVSMRK